jgi:hypothetical protein
MTNYAKVITAFTERRGRVANNPASVPEVAGSNLSSETGYSDRGF